MDVILRCQDCGEVLRVDARTRDWPTCRCGSRAWRLQDLAAERVERADDDDAWKNSYDDWKTGGGKPW